MKNKNEVYLVVDTPKKAKKLAKVLDMFGEPLHSDHSMFYALLNKNQGWVIKFIHQQFISREAWGTSTDTFGLKEVTIKELRNILAVEHLKEGDVVVVSNDYSKWIVKLTGKRLHEFEHSESYDMDLKNFVDHSIGLTINRVSVASFIRYATEEEKALLNPKPELEVGKWYKHAIYTDFLKFYKDDLTAYGFNKDGVWTEWEFNVGWPNDTKNYTEATPQEVEQALIKEAKKRYKVGDKVTQLRDYYYGDSSNIIEDVTTGLSSVNKIIGRANNGFLHCLFNAGKWAEVVKEYKSDDRFSEEQRLEFKKILKANSKLYYRIKPSGRIIFNRSIINLTRGYGDWKEYTGQDINELI